MNKQETESVESKADNLTKSDKGSDKGSLEALSDPAYEALRFLHDNPTDNFSIRALMDEHDLTRYYAKKYIEELLNGHYIERIGSGSGTTYEITPAGRSYLENTPPSYLTKSDKNQSEEIPEDKQITGRVDNLSYRIEFSDRCMIPEYGKATVLRELGEGWEYDEANEQYYYDEKRFHVRLSGERAVIYLREEYKGMDVTALKSEAIEEILEIKEWLESDCKLDFKDHALVMAGMNTQDVAIENHPIVQLARDHTDVALADVSPAIDSEGRIRLFLDHSGTGDLEGSNVGFPSGYGKHNEDDLAEAMDILAHQMEHKDGWRGIRRLAEFLESKDILEDLQKAASSDGSGSYEVSHDGSVTVDKKVDGLQVNNVSLKSVSMSSSTSERVQVSASESEEKESDDSGDFEPVSVSEDISEWDVRNLPGEEFRDPHSERVWEVWFLDLNSLSTGSDGSEADKVILTSDGEEKKVELDDLKRYVKSGDLIPV